MCSLERLCRPVQERRSAMPVARVPDAAGIVRRMDAAANPGPRPRERRPINHPDKREAFRDLGLDAVRVAQRTPRIRQVTVAPHLSLPHFVLCHVCCNNEAHK